MDHPLPTANRSTVVDDDIQQLLRLANATSFSYRPLFQQDVSRTVLERWPLLNHMEPAAPDATPTHETSAQKAPSQETPAQTPAKN